MIFADPLFAFLFGVLAGVFIASIVFLFAYIHLRMDVNHEIRVLRAKQEQVEFERKVFTPWWLQSVNHEQEP